MAEKNQMISRLKNEGQRIRTMVTPWLRSYLPGSKTLGHLPEQNLAIGIKSRNAAKKMRFLHPENPGSIQPETLLHQAKLFKDRTSQYRQLLHVNPRVSRDSGLWSKVEQVLPSGTAPESGSPPEPGVLQQGSIIPKMSIFPKKGQSISEFKDQIQSSELFNKPKPAVQVDKKPRILPNSRVFARVQEITGNGPQELPGGDEAETEESPVQPSSPAPKSTEPSLPAAHTTIQRQVEAQETLPVRQISPLQTRVDQKPTSDTQELKPESKPVLPSPTIQKLPVSIAEQPGKVLAQPIESTSNPPAPVQNEKTTPLKRDVLAQEESKPARMESRISQQPESLPLRLPVARPVSKKTEQTILKARAVPIIPLKSATSLDRQPSEKVSLPLTRAAAVGSTSKVVQRQMDHKNPAQIQKRAMNVSPAEHGTGSHDKPISKVLQPGDGSLGKSDQPLAMGTFRAEPSDLTRPGPDEIFEQPGTHFETGTKQSDHSTEDKGFSVSAFQQLPEMVLQRHLEAKKNPPLQIRSGDAVQFREARKLRGTVGNLVKLTHPEKKFPPPARESDTRPNLSKTTSQGALPQSLQPSTGIPLFFQPTTGMENKTPAIQPLQELFSTPVPNYDHLAMDLPRPPKIVQVSKPSLSQPVTTDKKQPAEALEVINNDKSQVVQRSLDNPMENVQNAVGKVQNKVMGKLGLGGGKSEENSGGNSSGNNSGDNSSSPNLEKLADDVFPLIKRLLEIEKDRISGLLR
jgi:hypothetical protein